MTRRCDLVIHIPNSLRTPEEAKNAARSIRVVLGKIPDFQHVVLPSRESSLQVLEEDIVFAEDGHHEEECVEDEDQDGKEDGENVPLPDAAQRREGRAEGPRRQRRREDAAVGPAALRGPEAHYRRHDRSCEEEARERREADHEQQALPDAKRSRLRLAREERA